MPVLTTNARAVLWVIIGTAIFSVVYASGKFAGDTASSPQIIFLRYIGGLIVLFAIVWMQGQRLRDYRSPRPVAHLGRAITGCFGATAINHASAKMPIVDATAFAMLYVVLVIPLAIVFFKEKVARIHWVAILAATIGAATILLSRGAFQTVSVEYLIPAFIAGGGALLLAFEGLLIKALSEQEKPMSVLLHVNIFGLLLLSGPAYLTWESIDLLESLPFVLLGPFAISAQYCIIRGYRMADIAIVGPIDYTWLIFAGFIGVTFFGEIPTIPVMIGAGLIAGSGILLSVQRAG